MTATLDARWYTSDEIYEAERSSVWHRNWFVFATESDVREPGAYVADSVAGWPIAVVRSPDGQLRGYLNVCPHRAGPVVWPGTGRTGNLVCRYHGWAFDWSGSLSSARDFGDDVCSEENSLTPVLVETWGPLVFVCLDPTAPSLRSTLADLDSRVSEVGFHRLPYGRRLVRELACNWKTYVDNYLEAYHVPLLHPLLRSALDMKSYEVSIPDPSYCLHRSGVADDSPSAGVWVFRYPNLALNVYPDAMNVERIVPLSTERTRIVYDYYALDPSEETMSSMIEMSNVTLDEDQAIAEVVQANLRSGAYRRGRLSPRHEVGLAWFQDRVRHDLGE